MNNMEVSNLRGNLDIAIIGMAGRFPGARNLDEFWQNLHDGIESITFFTDEELAASGIEPTLLSDPDYVKAKPVLEGIDMFDALFFGFNAKEAETMDPQHRLSLECAWESLENAGYCSEEYNGQIGVYVGSSLSTYLIFNLLSNPEIIKSVDPFQTLITNMGDFIPTRISYKLNLKGPSVRIGTACSTSLVNINFACQNLLSYQCDMALAGGVCIGVPQNAGFLYQEGLILSPDGHCRAFDAKAKGTVGGNGLGIVVLKRLNDAVADGDCIHAVIKGSAINNDGSLKVAYTAPSVDGQKKVIAEAQAIAGVDPDTISYIEAHGTGTVLGDPIEIDALIQVFRASTQRKGFCAIGSVKTNIGHTDSAAGVAGLIKTVLALKHKMIPPSLHFEKPNPNIDFANSPFYVNTSLSKWKKGEYPRRAGVSSFGIGGTNAHLILEEAPILKSSSSSKPWQLLVLSAKTDSALEKATTNLVEHLKQNSELNLADVAYTLQVGRKHFNYRRAVLCRDIDDAVTILETRDPEKILTVYQEHTEQPVVFMFSGQGSQHPNMALETYKTEPAFRKQIDFCSEFLKPYIKSDLRNMLYPSKKTAEKAAAQKLKQTTIAQPTLFAIEYALAKLWMEYGIRPKSMVGHSIGEYVAACLSGVFSIEDALVLVTVRGRMMQQLPAAAMLGVPLPPKEIQAFLGKELSIAAINGPSLCVVSGPAHAVGKLQRRLTERGVECRYLHTSHAFHSKMMEPIIGKFTEWVKKINLKPPQIPYLSNVTGTWITASEATDPNYWSKHLCQTIYFDKNLQQLLKEPKQILLEVGPGRTLSTLAMRHPDKTPEQVVFSSLPHPRDKQSDIMFLLTTLSKLWLAGKRIDWPKFYANEQRRRLPLPTYPFEHQRYWVELNKRTNSIQMNQISLSKNTNIADWFYLPLWKQSISPTQSVCGKISDQKYCWLMFVNGSDFDSQLVKRLKEKKQDVITVKIGSKFTKLGNGSYTINPKQHEDYYALIEELGALNKKPDKAIHLWNITRNSQPKLGLRMLNRAQNTGFYSLLYLVQAFDEQGFTHDLQIMVVSNNMHDVTGKETLRPEKATILGAVKVIPQEYPNIACRSIDIAVPKAESRDKQHFLDVFLAELNTKSSDTVVAYRGNHRWVQYFEPIQLDKSNKKAPRLKKGGVYLITGGLGGIGFVLAKHLAKTVNAKLILTGRSPLPPVGKREKWLATHNADDITSQKIKELQELESMGGEVIVACADVANQQQMQEVIASAEEQFGRINGIIHCAGIADGAMIRRRTREITENVLAPKLKGTIVLDRIFKDTELDLFVLCSSISSVLAPFGQVGYVAANSFLDAYAHYKAANGRFTVSIDWDAWQKVGMALKTLKQLSKIHTISDYLPELKDAILPSEGIEVFDRILERAWPRIVVSTQDLLGRIDKRINLGFLGQQDESESKEPLSLHSRPNLSTPFVAPRNEVEQIIANLWQKLFGTKDIGIHDSFFDLGGHSLLATQLISRLRKTLGVELSLRSVFEKHTIAKLAELITAKQVEQMENVAFNKVLTEIDKLSDEEVTQWLLTENK
jgi:acyl transferase domain-containing protein/acyl carrier protein